jgi:hypothetical protein
MCHGGTFFGELLGCACVILIHFDEFSDGFEDMLDLVDVSDSSGNENNDIPLL